MRYFHTALSVTSIEKSQRFYEEVFGLTLKKQGERPELGIKFIALEDKNSGSIVELIEHEKPTPLEEDLMDFKKVGIKHVSFIVDNIEEVIESAIKSGGKIIWPPKQGITVKRIAFIADPDGIPLELVEV